LENSFAVLSHLIAVSVAVAGGGNEIRSSKVVVRQEGYQDCQDKIYQEISTQP
jgi:hypothetical protein